MQRRAFTAGMFDGLVYLVDTANGTSRAVFDCEDIVPHVEVPVSTDALWEGEDNQLRRATEELGRAASTERSALLPTV